LVVLVFLDGVYISRAAAGVFLPWPGKRSPDAQKVGPLALSTTVLLGAGAVIAGALLKNVVEVVTARQFTATEPGWQWTISAAGASILGLSFGTWRVLVSGPVPAFSSFPAVLASGLYRATIAPATALLAIGSRLWPEHALDSAARGIASLASHAARAVDAIEAIAFDRGAAELANGIWKSGGRVRLLETGRVYVYTGGVFAWVILIMIVFAAIWR
jgi:NADH-quinone oxidoreductase subunit L